MNAPAEMVRIVAGKRYSTATATLIASDLYWDGSNWERSGRNRFLYRTPRGAFFTVRLTQWQGERDTLTPIDEAEARDLWDTLPEHAVSWAVAFGEEPQEA